MTKYILQRIYIYIYLFDDECMLTLALVLEDNIYTSLSKAVEEDSSHPVHTVHDRWQPYTILYVL